MRLDGIKDDQRQLEDLADEFYVPRDDFKDEEDDNWDFEDDDLQEEIDIVEEPYDDDDEDDNWDFEDDDLQEEIDIVEEPYVDEDDDDWDSEDDDLQEETDTIEEPEVDNQRILGENPGKETEQSVEKKSDVEKSTQENPEGKKKIDETAYWNKQGELAKEAFDKGKSPIETDESGNKYKELNKEEKIGLSDKCKEQIADIPKGERGNYRVPEPEKIKGISMDEDGKVRIEENWKAGTDGAKEGTRHMEVVRAKDESGHPTYIDRVGGENGNYFSPLDSEGEPYSLKKRATGDYMPEETLQDNDSYHLYEVKQDFTRENFENAVKETYEGKQNVINDKLFKLNDYYSDASDDDSDYHVGEKYCDCSQDDADGIKAGDIDEMFLSEGNEYGKEPDGGGKQYITPFTVQELKEMRMIQDVRKEDFNEY